MQPRYLTAVQTPWPGLVIFPLLIAFLLLAQWARSQRRHTQVTSKLAPVNLDERSDTREDDKVQRTENGHQ